MGIIIARMPEWSKGVDLSSTVRYVLAGSNPAPCTQVSEN